MRAKMQERATERPKENEAVEEERRPECRHHWIIEPPSGPTSRGRCKHCGEERLFINSSGEWLSDGVGRGFSLRSDLDRLLPAKEELETID